MLGWSAVSGGARRTTACQRRHGCESSGGCARPIPNSATFWLRKNWRIVVSRETVQRIQTRLKLHRPKKRGEKRVLQIQGPPRPVRRPGPDRRQSARLV